MYRINYFFALLAILFTTVITYALWVYSGNSFKPLYVSVAATNTLTYLFFTMAFAHQNEKKTINVRTLSVFFFFINVVHLLYFSGTERGESAFIISASLIILPYIAFIYGITRAKT